MTTENNVVTAQAIYHPVIEVNRENGVFTIDGNEITGYRIERSEKSQLTLTWDIPDSQVDMINLLKKENWKNDDVSYDDFDCDADSYTIQSFDENGEEIDDEYEDEFDGDGNLELEFFEVNRSSLKSITLFYDNEKEFLIEREDFSSYEDFLKKVEELLCV